MWVGESMLARALHVDTQGTNVDPDAIRARQSGPEMAARPCWADALAGLTAKARW